MPHPGSAAPVHQPNPRAAEGEEHRIGRADRYTLLAPGWTPPKSRGANGGSCLEIVSSGHSGGGKERWATPPRMLRVARQQLGADAPLEQLALHCHIQRITPRIRKILRRMERAA